MLRSQFYNVRDFYGIEFHTALLSHPLEQVATNTGPRSAAWFLAFLGSINNFSHLCNYLAVAQWIKCLAGELKDPGSFPGQVELFSLKFLLKRK